MKCILLAAGYATRLYPLTKNKPKSLLEVAGKTILQYIIDKLNLVTEIDEIYIVTNDVYFQIFSEWASKCKCNKKIETINNYTTNNENRLGAIGDLQFVLDLKNVNENILVMACDNLFDFDLRDFISFYMSVQCDCITTHELADFKDLKRTGVIEVNSDFSVKSFEEKPMHPKSSLAVPPFYIFKKETILLIKQYLSEGNNVDAPGNFIPWLIGRKPVFAYKFEGMRYDIGTHESYAEANEVFKRRNL